MYDLYEYNFYYIAPVIPLLLYNIYNFLNIGSMIKVIHCFYYMYMKAVLCITVLVDGRVVSGSCDKTLRIWNLTSGKCDKVLEGHTKVSIYAIVMI